MAHDATVEVGDQGEARHRPIRGADAVREICLDRASECRLVDDPDRGDVRRRFGTDQQRGTLGQHALGMMPPCLA
jgi:hypothetical protein